MEKEKWKVKIKNVPELTNAISPNLRLKWKFNEWRGGKWKGFFSWLTWLKGRRFWLMSFGRVKSWLMVKAQMPYEVAGDHPRGHTTSTTLGQGDASCEVRWVRIVVFVPLILRAKIIFCPQLSSSLPWGYKWRTEGARLTLTPALFIGGGIKLSFVSCFFFLFYFF